MPGLGEDVAKQLIVEHVQIFKLNIFVPIHRKYEPLWGYYTALKKCELNQNTITLDRNALIKNALAIARAKGVNAPYFKKMKDKEISAFITRFS